MKKTLLMLAFLPALALSACTFDELNDGYQFGDVAKMTEREFGDFLEHRKAYCDVAQSSAIRNAALRLLQLKYPWIPAEGICTRLPTITISQQP